MVTIAKILINGFDSVPSDSSVELGNPIDGFSHDKRKTISFVFFPYSRNNDRVFPFSPIESDVRLFFTLEFMYGYSWFSFGLANIIKTVANKQNTLKYMKTGA